MPYCAVITCKRRTETNNLQIDGTSFHRFPSKPDVKEKWITAVGRGPVWWPSKTSTICSNHFKESQFQVLPKKRKLFDWALPTLKLPVMPITSSSTCDIRYSTLTSDGSNNVVKIEFKEVDSKSIVKEVIYFDNTSGTSERQKAELTTEEPSKNKEADLCQYEEDESESQMDPLNLKKQEIAMQDEAQSMHKMHIQLQRYKSALIHKNRKIRLLLRKTQRYRVTIVNLRKELRKSQKKNVLEKKNISENSS